MKICKKCGTQLEENCMFCINCGTKVEEESRKVEGNYNKPVKSNNNGVKILIAILIVLVVALFGVFLVKDNIMYSYYKSKGDKANSSTVAIEYYTEALNMRYTNEIIEKINNALKTDDNFENTLFDLKGIVNDNDLNNMYVKVYVSKAKDNFNNKNYETTWDYLYKAESYNYNINTFEYYNDLMKIPETENSNVTQNIYISNNNPSSTYSGKLYDYYIIPDSDIRYLTKSELLQYNKDTLGFIRNEIFARHGYMFKKQVYRDYFDSMPWYYPNSSFKGSLNELNKVERANVELIKSLE
ncbi:MAG: YARHG domain-containing protein [Peptostreptococcaceae bacterium]